MLTALLLIMYHLMFTPILEETCLHPVKLYSDRFVISLVVRVCSYLLLLLEFCVLWACMISLFFIFKPRQVKFLVPSVLRTVGLHFCALINVLLLKHCLD